MSGRLVSPIFIGRRRESLAVADLVDGVAAGRPGTILLGGEAGVGKTRLCEAASRAAEAAGTLVLRGGCIRLGSGELPFAPIAAALRDMARQLDERTIIAVVGDRDPVLRRIVDLGRPSRAPAGGKESPETARGKLLRALFDVLARLADVRPTLLVLEDLHWADSASLDAVAFLVRSLRAERVGLLLTFRSDELHRRHPLRAWLGEVERIDAVERLELRPFVVDETRELIAAIRGGSPAPELVEAIQARSDGNPFFIEELLASEAATGPTDLTTGLRDVLLARVASVPEQAQPALRAAAVAGRRVETPLLAEVSGLRSGAFDAALEASVERGVLIHERDRSGDWLTFRHALIQEVIDDELLPGERIRLHRAFAEALARRPARSHVNGPGAWAIIADHWERAGDTTRAFEAALKAAAEAGQAYAFGAALIQYRRALRGWELVAEPGSVAGFDRVELLSRTAEAAWLSGQVQSQVALLREAINEADELDDRARGALLRGQLGYALWVSGNSFEARQAYEAAVARLPPGPPSSERAWLLARLAQALMLEAGYTESVRLAEVAVSMAGAAADRRVEAHALNTLAASLGELGQGRRAIETIERALAVALELEEPDEVGRAYLNATEILATCGLDHRALELVRQGFDRTAAMGTTVAYGNLILIHGADIAYQLGRWAEAAELAVADWIEQTDANTEVYVLARIVPLTVGCGRWEIARAQLARMLALTERFAAEAQYSGPYGCAAAELAMWESRPADALAAVDWGLSRLERTDDVRHRIRLRRLGLRAAADLAVMARDRHDPAAEAEARGFAEALRDRTAALGATIATMDGGLATELAADNATAAAEDARLHGVADPSLWAEAAARWLARERPYQRAYACWREAEASFAAGDRRRATEALRIAGEIARRLGAEPLETEVRALARRGRISLERRETTAVPSGGSPERATLLAAEFGLTRRELDVLELLAQGMTNRQIAADLFISVYTAGVHVSRILGKLDVTSRTEAASKAYRLGLVRH